MQTDENKTELMMNMLHMHEGKIFNTFKEFLLSESLSIQSTNYGTNDPDFDDSNVLNNQSHRMSFFNNKGIYVVSINSSNEVVFTKMKKFDSITDFTTYKTLTNDMEHFRIFGQVMYIIIEMMKTIKLKSVYFDGLTSQHIALYTKLFQNKYIQRDAKKHKIKLEIKTNQLGTTKFYISL